MTDQDIVAGEGGFQKADLMDYGSLYGMGSCFGELHRLAPGEPRHRNAEQYYHRHLR
jgi:hypothetical protein